MAKPKTRVRKPVERPVKVEAPTMPRLMETTNYDTVEFAGTKHRMVRTLDQDIEFLSAVISQGPKVVSETHKIQIKSVYGRACMLRKKFKAALKENNAEAAILYRKLSDSGIIRPNGTGQGSQEKK